MGAPRSNRSTIAVAASGLLLIAAGATARHLFAAHAKPPAPVVPVAPRGGVLPGEPDFVLHVPHTPGAILLDGDTDDPGWVRPPGPARTRAFLAPNGTPARPFSEIRTVWGDGYLYLSLYAADEDIESRTTEADGPLWLDDAFRVVFTRQDTQYAIEVSPRAIITDSVRQKGPGGWGAWDYTWSAGVHASKEMDGTLNAPNNMDEEWVIEMAVPFESLGLQGDPGESIGFSASRCDTPRNAPRTCASWGDGAVAGRIVLE
jgi:hypothetical protein